MGQQDGLAKLDRLLWQGAEGDLKVAIKDTFGKVLYWRDKIQGWFRQYAVAAQQILACHDCDELDVGFSHFSDTIIAHCTMPYPRKPLDLAGTYAMIMASGMLMHGSLVEGTVFRGAIVAGNAALLPPQSDLYGPAIAEAHHLESRTTGYPRIVVSKRLVEILRKVEEQQLKQHGSRGIASLCLELLRPDTDGCHIVDYMGRGFFKNLPLGDLE